MFERLWARFSSDPFINRAVEDQTKTDYPGCNRGIMFCRCLCADCSGSRPNSAFIRARAEALRKEAQRP